MSKRKYNRFYTTHFFQDVIRNISRILTECLPVVRAYVINQTVDFAETGRLPSVKFVVRSKCYMPCFGPRPRL